MNKTKYTDEEILIETAIKILNKELGPVETSRFINLPKKQRIESVKRHRLWQKSLDEKQFLDAVFQDKQRKE
ncbi:hypothetical protein GF407_00265 [candidate division KSB1 bacterium]|nr:hypothetical protein [candidate division KSB1 bacterium]